MAVGNGAVIWGPLWTKHLLGLVSWAQDAWIDFVAAPGHPLGGNHRWVELDNSGGDQPHLRLMIESDVLGGNGPAGQRSAIKFSQLIHISSGAAVTLPATLIRCLYNVSSVLHEWLLRLTTDNKLLLYRDGNLQTSDDTLSEDTDYLIIVWKIYRNAGGTRINDHWVVQVITDPYGTPSTTTFIDVTDTVQHDFDAGAVSYYWYAGDADDTLVALFGTGYIAWEDAASPSGAIRNSLLLPVSGVPTYDDWSPWPVNGGFKWARVNETPPNDDTDYCYHLANPPSIKRQSHQMTFNAVPVGHTIPFVEHLMWWKDLTLGKTGAQSALIVEGANLLETEYINQTDQVGYVNFRPMNLLNYYGDRPVIWQTAPDETEWNLLHLNLTDAGYGMNSGTGTAQNVSHVSLMAAHWTDSLPAPPDTGETVAAIRRRFGLAV